MDKHTQRFIEYYMKIAEVTANMSYGIRLKVGSCIVVDNGIISTGYNGQPAGEDNSCCDLVNGELVTKTTVIHAEENAIRRTKERNLSCRNGSIFVTHQPCKKCASLILSSGIDSVFYRNSYRDNAGVELLLFNDVNVIKV